MDSGVPQAASCTSRPQSRVCGGKRVVTLKKILEDLELPAGNGGLHLWLPPSALPPSHPGSPTLLSFDEGSIMKGSTFMAVLSSWVERSRKREAHRICRRAHPPCTTKPPFIFSSITLYPLHCVCASECSPSRRPVRAAK
ncbi:hypothetical protein AOLI_G00227100 [Acnodon oligacanthus]